jgi:predicted transglutaminase-like cysteine proteinase
MVVTGRTTQPIGHYEYCKEYRSDCEVRSRDTELLNPAMEKQMLETMATETRGRFLTEPDLAKLPELLESTSATIPRRKSIDLFALWPFLLLTALLLFAEWTLRRLSSLK